MALRDLSSPEAVLHALTEYDRLGQDAFLRAYGFGRARQYQLLYGGRRYDSKAIAGAAHRYQFPELGPLQARDFSGGEVTVASRLRSLGFEVVTGASEPPWDLAVGETLPRREVHRRYGGAPFGGIEPSRSTPNVLLFTNPASGEQHGYFDGWADDGCFHYTGEGQRGDQQFREGNKAVRHHEADGRILRLFRASGPEVTYLGAFTTDSQQPYYFTDAPETGGGPLRTVIVFRLRPVGQVLRRDAERIRVPGGPRISEVAVEAHNQDRYRVQRGTNLSEAERREAALVVRYRGHLEQRGVEVVRLAIRPGSELRPLYCDLFNKSNHELVEAKGTVTREALRLALGQLLDYRRFIDPRPAMVLLVPMRPRPDLLALLQEYGVRVVWEEEQGHFAESQP